MKRQLPQEIEALVETFVEEISRILGPRLHGIYMHGAAVFPDPGPVLDVDCHVVLKKPLEEEERRSIIEVLDRLDEEHPGLGGAPDAYFVLLDAARSIAPPEHQLDTSIIDTSWALHCAHIRAGRYETLHGPEPTDLFPAPSWEDIDAGLMEQLDYIRGHLSYPAYCVLNLCRIVYSYTERDVVVSKLFSGEWAQERFPEWAPLIAAAARYNAGRRYFTGERCPEDDELLLGQLPEFLLFAMKRIDAIRGNSADGQSC